MSRWTVQDYANYESRRGVKLEIVSEPKSRVKHDYKAEFEQQLGLVKIPVEHEFVFAPPRKFRADWRVVDTRILIEFEGGLFSAGKGGHSSISGIHRDIEKYNTAALQGWIVIRITPKHVASGEALSWVVEATNNAVPTDRKSSKIKEL